MLEIQDGNIPQSQRGPNHSDVCPGLQFSPDTHRRTHTPKRPQQIKSWESKGETWKFQFLLCYKFSKYEEICQIPLIIYSELMTNREMPPEQFMDSVSPKSDPVGKWPKNPSLLSQQTLLWPGSTLISTQHYKSEQLKAPFAVNLIIPLNIPKPVYKTYFIWGPDLILG